MKYQFKQDYSAAYYTPSGKAAKDFKKGDIIEAGTNPYATTTMEYPPPPIISVSTTLKGTMPNWSEVGTVWLDIPLSVLEEAKVEKKDDTLKKVAIIVGATALIWYIIYKVR